MNATTARDLALRLHAGQLDRSGGRLIDHIARVAATVPAEAHGVAWMHESLEHAGGTESALLDAGLGEVEVAAVRLLTRHHGEPYDVHVLNLASAPGPAGHLARTVKLADLDDHLAHGRGGDDAPPYAWARRHIAWARRQQRPAPTPPVAA